MTAASFQVNGRTYTAPDGPVVVICIDGSEPEYHEAAVAAGRMPWLAKVLDGTGASWDAHCAVPTLTNPNNMSIATGRPPRVHGISGNYFFDRDSGEEVLMNDAKFLRAPTIFAAAADAGLSVAVVTAKDKLRRLLGAGLVEVGLNVKGSGELVEPANTGICFSAEKADEAKLSANGIDNVLDLVGLPLPSVYSAELSEFALAAGVRIMQERKPDLMYLSLTDYIQHKNAPGTETANDFYAMIDSYAQALDELGAVVVITADHGMSAKHHDDGTPRVIYVEDEVNAVLGLDGESGKGENGDGARVILPITDPYTVHHGALGSFASVYLPEDSDRDSVLERLRSLPGVHRVFTAEEGAPLLELPDDRVGDILVLADKNTALGRYAAWHDLSNLEVPLRSHGGLGELRIPFIINRRLPVPAETEATSIGGENAAVHNYDAYWVATTHLVRSAIPSEAAV
ncbi:phosphonoacetate hydrolase [Saxibacter everestensis]|uniref:Phosphonoacetate hydrolase n=1 Tax=Saxibacter everestensis TaxID=2909229 RepID=A0ABY8QTD9_9MICO|nr:phosphonoacetate hydrolase [Brevibacteriaceae bacterium ZFBP1038]